MTFQCDEENYGKSSFAMTPAERTLQIYAKTLQIFNNVSFF